MTMAGRQTHRRSARGPALALVLALGGAAAGATETAPTLDLVVSTTRAGGAGSLDAALRQANAASGPVRVVFAIPPADAGFDVRTGTWTVRLATPLPPLTRSRVMLDAATQPVARGADAGRPRLALAAARPGLEQAITIASADNTIRGFAVGGFKYGIVLYGPGASGNTVEGNYIGLSPAGDVPQPNETGIIVVEGAHGNALVRNVVSGNTRIGIYIGGSDSTRNRILGNCIGCDPTGSRRVPNAIGIMIARAAGNVIGEPDSGNVVSGNADIGILLAGKGTERNAILGNRIGTDRAGARPVFNNIGVVVKSLANRNSVGGAGRDEGNTISGNIEIGLYIEAADGNRILGNRIGTDAAGRRVVREGEVVQGNGVEFNTVAKDNVLGGLAPGERNVISGHKVYGVVYYGHCARNATVGNYIGTDASGRSPLPNATGICVDCASHHNDIADNVISGNLSYGLFFVTRGTEYNTLRGNRIGTDADGSAAVPNDIGVVIGTGASRNRVGGTDRADRNIISGNRQAGIMITNRLTEENVVEGNVIGADARGTTPLPNRRGVIVSTYPRRNRVEDNVITGNTDVAVVLCEQAASNTVAHNVIGGSPALVVQDRAGAGNVVADNPGRGAAP